MATRSMIGYINKNNRVKLGYCHYDGELEHNGIILQNYYNNMEIVKNLLKGKGVYFLTDNIRKNEYYRDDYLVSNHMTLDDLLMNLDEYVMTVYFYLYHEKMNKWLYIIHLTVLVQWALIIVPLGKWTHFLYRSFAMYFVALKTPSVAKKG